MVEKTLEVPEVSCNHCINAIEGAVGALGGVESVKVNLDRKDVTVSYDESAQDLAHIVAAIEGEGYGVGPQAAQPQVMQIGDKPSQ
ncbi:MAG TPA: copper ion binding protein [Actinomycetota bacterium]|nr:copper ion binding protein [Actinomycetota bacterium]